MTTEPALDPPALPTPIARALCDVATEGELRATWQAVRERRAPSPKRAWWLAAPALLAFLVWLAWPRPTTPDAIARLDGAPFEAVHAAVALNDGSRITPEDDGALRVLENQAGVLALHLERGAARFEVTPGTNRRWRIEADGVVVEVVGTVFTVDRRDGVHVAVERGAVVVRGDGVPDGVRRLGVGESIWVPRSEAAPHSLPHEVGPVEAAVEAASPEAASPAAAPPEAVPPETAPPAATEEAPTEAPSSATTEPVRVAPVAVEPAIETVSPPPISAAELMAMADAARAEGRDADALPILDRIVREYPSAPEAPLAAFTAARIAERRGDHAGAIERFETARALGLPPELDVPDPALPR